MKIKISATIEEELYNKIIAMIPAYRNLSHVVEDLLHKGLNKENLKK